MALDKKYDFKAVEDMMFGNKQDTLLQEILLNKSSQW